MEARTGCENPLPIFGLEIERLIRNFLAVKTDISKQLFRSGSSSLFPLVMLRVFEDFHYDDHNTRRPSLRAYFLD